MSVDTPARIAIIGAGPLGLEAALYARFLGYDVDLYERGRVAEHIRKWGHVRMFTPFGMNSTPLAIGALQTQDPAWKRPAADELLSGHDYCARYLVPLSQADLVVDSLREQTEVLAVGRDELLKGDLVGDPGREEFDFVLLIRTPENVEKTVRADVVLDCSGVLAERNALGLGGLPARGERELRSKIIDTVPDVLGADRARFANRRLLVVGAGFSAATTVAAVAELTKSAPQTSVVWATRRDRQPPIRRVPNDALPERDRIAQTANALVLDPDSGCVHRPACWVDEVRWSNETKQFQVTFAGEIPGLETFDEVAALVGYRPDLELLRELQVHTCYATEGPMKLAAALAANPSPDCLKQAQPGPAALFNPEPHLYILGSKSYGRYPQFMIQTGLKQIVELFTILGDRPGLNLYQTIRLSPS